MERLTIRIGKEDLILETGRMAKQANGSAFVTYGGSSVLATVCCSSQPTPGLDFVPLQVEYNERYYAAGKIPGGFLKREGRPKDKEILVSRLIDRPMRPLFSKKFGREIQVVPTVVSTDQINPPDMVAMIAASAAVTISDIPFDGPIAGVRVAYLDGGYIINPTFEEIKNGQMDIVVAGTEEGITMVEGGAKEVSEDVMLTAIEKAHAVIADVCRQIRGFAARVGKEKLPLAGSDLRYADESAVRAFAEPLYEKASFVKNKLERHEAKEKVRESIFERFTNEETPEEEKTLLGALCDEIEKEVVRQSVLNKGIRIDGRKPDEIRPITCEVGVLSRTHGSALFTRGETQSLGVVTLGTTDDGKLIDDIDGDKSYEHFMLHYNFPPYSVGETGRLTTGRREIGHGHLALRALESMVPDSKEFPYTIRVVSEILESNGSSSMATVCSGTLSLLDAGVPIKKPVAGIAMGLISDGDKAVVLSDILGDEDHLGDMDFKVTGTAEGITAFQMDIKIKRIAPDLMRTALEQAKQGRLHILSIMNQTLSRPRSEVSRYAPKIVSIRINPDKVGAVIGSGGKTIKALTEKTSSQIVVEEDGTVQIYGKDKESAEKAMKMIEAIATDPKPGTLFTGVVKKIMDFGAFVEFVPGKEGLVHISKLADHRVDKVTDVLQEGQTIPVKVLEVDKLGRINLSYIDAVRERKPE